MADRSPRPEELSTVKRALIEVREMRQRLEEMTSRHREPIAIIGLGLRFPGGANDPESYWQLLENGVDAIREVPPDRWDIDAFYDPDIEKPGKMNTRYGGFIDDVDQFDPSFFDISPREAESLDPQQRLLLEVSWEALENAGQAPERLFGSKMGVFVGISNSDYFRMIVADPEKIDTYATTGTALSIAAGRLSYTLGLHGPNVAIDTACSSSLVAIHLAVRSLRSGECDMALAGGVSLMLSPDLTINFSKAQMMAADGRCKTFDARADGYVRGEGCGLVVLKRLSDAQAASDPILAVVRGSAINQDGRSAGLTAPNGPAQEAVIAQALADGGVDPLDVSYVEAHGTGTSLGDPIEVHALVSALCRNRPASRPLALGSVKTNLGHLEAAAGIAGLIKTVLSMQYHQIPPHLHMTALNPHISLNGAPIVIYTQKTAWESGDKPLVAGVSSFGLSGTNSHVILQEAPAIIRTPVKADRSQHLLTLSAKSEKALKTLAGRYEQALLKTDKQAKLADIGFTANMGRSHFNNRLAIVAGDVSEAAQMLKQYQINGEPKGWVSGTINALQVPELAFLFTGHGAHYASMGRHLFETNPVFYDAMQECNHILLENFGVDILRVLYPIQTGESSLLDQMAYTQMALFSLQVALAKLWQTWGIEPSIVMGHSGGEYAAAWLAGIFTLPDALRLVMARGRLLQSTQPGVMATVFADEDIVARVIEPYASAASIASLNGPKNTVISGSRDVVDAVLETLRAQRVKFRLLPIGQAAHSPLVETVLDEFEKIATSIKLTEPTIPLVSSLTGKMAVAAEITLPHYWRDHLRQPVRFADAIRTLGEKSQRIFLEIGPNPMLLAMGQRCLPDNKSLWLPSLREGWEDWKQMLESLGVLYVQGVPVDWDSFDRLYHRQRVSFPTYPWERKSYWWTDSRALQRPKKTVHIWDKAVESGLRQSDQAPLGLEISTFDAKWDALNRLASSYMNNALIDLNLFETPGEELSIDNLLEKGHILPTYRSLVSRWLKLLTTRGDLRQASDGTYTSMKPFRRQSMDEVLNVARPILADIPFVVEYIQDCGEKLSAILVGAESPLEMMFPGGSMARAESLYQDWVHARYFHNIVRAVTETVVNATSKKHLRILEVGAGTGATTASVLPVLPLEARPESVIYYFTDVSDLFLERAREKFKRYPFVRYSLLDIEKDTRLQGYGSHQFDLVIAANVLHATHDLSVSLQNVQSLLSPDGILLLFEATHHQPWYDVTTGLIEGWQSFSDDLRTDSPLLSVDQWTQILKAEGFVDVAVFPKGGSPAEILGEHVFIARPPTLMEEGDEIADLEMEPGSQSKSITTATEPEFSDLLYRLQEAVPDERKEILLDVVRKHVSNILRLAPNESPDRRARLMDLGVDSLMAVELRSRLSRSLNLEHKLPATLVFDNPTIDAITDYILREVVVFDETKPSTASSIATTVYNQPSKAPNTTTAIETLTDDEVEALLIEKLKKLE